MTQNTVEEETKYIKRIDDLIEEAEIEAELEAEKKIRSKNTKLLGIFILAGALMLFIYVQLNDGVEVGMSDAEPDLPITEIRSDDFLPPEPVPSALPEPEKAEPAPVVDAAPPVAKNPAPAETEPTRPAPRAEAVQPAPAAPRAKPDKPKSQAAPVARVAKVQPAPSTSGGRFFVQTGSFGVEANARKFSKKLSAAGFSPNIRQKTKTLTRHVVVLGQYHNEESGQPMAKKLAGMGFKSAIRSSGEGSYTLEAGRFATAQQAEAVQDQLGQKGFLSVSEKKQVTTRLYTVEIGGFASRTQAQSAQKRLASSGFKNSFIR